MSVLFTFTVCYAESRNSGSSQQ